MVRADESEDVWASIWNLRIVKVEDPEEAKEAKAIIKITMPTTPYLPWSSLRCGLSLRTIMHPALP